MKRFTLAIAIVISSVLLTGCHTETEVLTSAPGTEFSESVASETEQITDEVVGEPDFPVTSMLEAENIYIMDGINSYRYDAELDIRGLYEDEAREVSASLEKYMANLSAKHRIDNLIYDFYGKLQIDGNSFYLFAIIDTKQEDYYDSSRYIAVNADFSTEYSFDVYVGSAFIDTNVNFVTDLQEYGEIISYNSSIGSRYVDIPFETEKLTDEESEKAASLMTYLNNSTNAGEKEDYEFDYTHSCNEKIFFDGEYFYVVWVRWLVEDENGKVSHSSRVTEVLINMDYSRYYSAWVSADEISVYLDNNFASEFLIYDDYYIDSDGVLHHEE